MFLLHHYLPSSCRIQTTPGLLLQLELGVTIGCLALSALRSYVIHETGAMLHATTF